MTTETANSGAASDHAASAKEATVEETAKLAAEFSERVAALNERASRIVQAWAQRQTEDGGFNLPDSGVITKAFMDLATQWWSDPARAIEQQSKLWSDYMTLWTATAQRLQGEEVAPVAEPAPGDNRFKDEAWSEEVLFDMIKQSYLLTSDWMAKSVRETEGLDEQTAKKVDFYTRQWINALSPSNFVGLNPKVLKTVQETKGENLLKGLDNLLADLEQGRGRLKISMTDTSHFELGRNVATTPGKVVFQNDMMQLIQYEPTTDKVRKRPLLFVPPWINKFYILDLQAKNSLIKWAVDQGNTVFVISWVNPDESLSHKGFDDYLLEGPLAAINAIREQTGEDSVNMAGYCLGGTLTASFLAWLTARGEESRVASATFFTTMLDFSDPGELAVFIDEEQLTLLEKHMEKRGYLEGSQMANVFNMMRDNDLIWSFVVNNYLLGRSPLPFDLLYWNGDSTRMPKMMHSFYLRRMYQQNDLIKPGAVELAGQKIDLTTVKVPSYFLSTREDHIAPWTSTYAATQIFSGPLKFVLAGSGHIAGVINPPTKSKYGFWTNSRKPKNPEAWLKAAKQSEGSWWPDWDAWLDRQKGNKTRIEARDPSKGNLKVIEEAPGSYVKVRSAD
ncbi:MAG: PHA/PHB synthase family protein [Magnetovibrionaceae bacterium]